MKKIKRKIFYKCRVCGRSSTDEKEAYKCFVSHGLETNVYVYCNVCGEGFSAKHYGEVGAREKAIQCYRKHVEKGEADELANRTFFLTHGAYGYPHKERGGME